MYDHRFWGPVGPYGAPLREDHWHYHESDIPCYAHVPWEGCPYPPDVCHDPRYAYPPPLPIMAPIVKGKGKDCECDCCKDEQTETNETTETAETTGVTYTLQKSGNVIKLVGSDGSESSVVDAIGDSTGYTETPVDTNTTYTLTRSGDNIVLTGSDGNTYTVQDNTSAGGEGVTYTIERSDDYIRLKGSDGSESNFRDVILSTWIGQKQIFWTHLADSLKKYILGQGIYTYVDGQTFATNHTPLIALNDANERTNLKVYTPGAYDDEMGIAFYEAVADETGFEVDTNGFDNRPLVETKTVNNKKYYKIRLYAGYLNKSNSCGVANVLLNLGWLPEGQTMDTRTVESDGYSWTYHTIPQANKGLFSVKANVKKEYIKMNNVDTNVIDIEFCEDDVTPVVWHQNAFNDGDLTEIPADAFTTTGTTYLGINLDMIMTTVYRQNLTIASITVERVN